MNPTKVGFRYMQRNKVVWVIVFYHMVLTKKKKEHLTYGFLILHGKQNYTLKTVHLKFRQNLHTLDILSFVYQIFFLVMHNIQGKDGKNFLLHCHFLLSHTILIELCF